MGKTFRGCSRNRGNVRGFLVRGHCAFHDLFAIGRDQIAALAPDILQDNNNLVQHDPLLYLPYRQKPRLVMFVAARTRVSPATLGDAFRRAVQAVDVDLPVRSLATLESQVELRNWKFVTCCRNSSELLDSRGLWTQYLRAT